MWRCDGMKETYKSRVYTDRPAYADFDERAKKLEFVRNPIAYALHKVWKMADREN